MYYSKSFLASFFNPFTARLATALPNSAFFARDARLVAANLVFVIEDEYIF